MDRVLLFIGQEQEPLNRRTTMIGKLAKMAAYARAPRATFTLMHPVKAAKYGAIYMLVKRMSRKG